MRCGESISKYRERLDVTLASPDLKNELTLKALIRDQLQRSSLEKREEGCSENLVERRTAEVSNFLDMLRTPSVDSPKSCHSSHGEWKVKQDTEEFRVMYREGPQGTPIHTLLVEGYVDGPVDQCLCISWESALYPKWWPQNNIPAFRITSSRCLHKIRIGEQISLVRMKVPWPLSAREALVHYFEFEYFEDDLIVALVNSISESERIDQNTHGYTREMIPEMNDVVRIDMVGGFSLQKVTSGRSYFRTIANVDVKLDFVPPSLMNFVSRQLIGNGFRLYQKAVASVFDSDEDFKKALVDLMYDRIRKTLFSKNKENNTPEIKDPSNIDQNSLDQDTTEHSVYDLNEVVQDHQKDSFVSETTQPGITVSEDKGINFEIEEVENEEDYEKEITNRTSDQDDDYKRRFQVSPEVKRALGTLEKVISLVREYRLKSPSRSSHPEEESEDSLEKLVPVGVEDFYKKEVRADASTKEDAEEGPDGLRQSLSSRSLRRKSSSGAREANHNRITPVSQEERVPISKVNGGEEKSGKGVDRQKRYRLCCFRGMSERKVRENKEGGMRQRELLRLNEFM